MDLRIRFGMDQREYDDRNCIIIVNVHETFVGFIVDTVAEVHEIPEANVDPSPTFKKRISFREIYKWIGQGR